MDINQAKALFIAQYWGQTFINGIGGHSSLSFIDLSDIALNKINAALLLRSIDQLSDEEIVTLYHIHCGEIAYDYTQDFKPVNDMAKHWIEMDGIKTLFKYRGTSEYLHLIGVITPLTYLDENQKPITLQPDEIVAMGWGKLAK